MLFCLFRKMELIQSYMKWRMFFCSILYSALRLSFKVFMMDVFCRTIAVLIYFYLTLIQQINGRMSTSLYKIINIYYVILNGRKILYTHLFVSTFITNLFTQNSCLHYESIINVTARSSEMSSPDGTMCKNGGTPIDGYTCMCPGGLVGKTCEFNNLCHLYNHIAFCIIKFKW